MRRSLQDQGSPILRAWPGSGSRLPVYNDNHADALCCVHNEIAHDIQGAQGRPFCVFSDLDVYFWNHPLAGVPKSLHGVGIFAQLDESHIQVPKRNTNWNYGCFLAMPTPSSIRLFEDLAANFPYSSAWDQGLFNSRLHAAHGPSIQALELSEYDSLMLHPDSSWVPSYGHLVAVHATCVEGSLTQHLAVEASWGPLPQLSLQC